MSAEPTAAEHIRDPGGRGHSGDVRALLKPGPLLGLSGPDLLAESHYRPKPLVRFEIVAGSFSAIGAEPIIRDTL